jgi:NADPH-dependent curcumin reductase CurA
MALGQSDFIANRSFFLKGYPDGFPEESLFELRENQLSTNLSKNSGDVLVKVLYFSLDPHMRNQMRPPQAGHAQGYGGFSLQEVRSLQSVLM